MDITQLKSALGIENDKLKGKQVSISTDTLNKNINDLLEYCYDNQPIVIDQAVYTPDSSKPDVILITGSSSFLEMSNLHAEAQFTIDNSHNTQLLIKYSLLDANPGANKWTFSQSFPKLPQIQDNRKPIQFNRIEHKADKPMVTPLDDLFLFNSYYVVTSAPRQEPQFKVPLQWGINFVGNLRPEGFLGVIENLFQYTDTLTIYGTIRKPLPTEKPETLANAYPRSPEKFLFPWDITAAFPKGLPGILLQVELNLDYSIADTVDFAAEKLYFYTPLEDSWILNNTNPPFIPMEAYTGKMTIKGAGICVDMVSPIEFGIDSLQLIGSFKGVSLSNLAHLTGLTGSSESPLEQLPDEIKKMGNELGKLELINAGISVDYSSLEDITVSNASFTVGMPDVKWKIWDSGEGKSHFEVDSIACTFDIDYPFILKATDPTRERKVLVTLYGGIKVENVPFTLYASNQDGFSAFAEMEEKQTIPLNKIVKTYAPGLMAPGDLTINTFRLGVIPGDSYSMALLMASEPDPWKIPLGPTELLVEDVSMGFSYSKSASVSGSISGTIQLKDIVKLDIMYDLPGDIIIRSYIPNISLRQIAGALTNQSLAVPDEFNLTFENNSILIQKISDNYVFQLATEIKDIGIIAFQIQKVNAQWGCALGIDMTAGMPSGFKGLSFLKAFEDLFALKKLMLVLSSFDSPGFTFPDMANFNNPILNTKKVSLPAQAGGNLVAGLNFYAQWQINTADKCQGLLSKFLGLDPLIGITLQVSKIPSQNSKLFVSYQTTIQGHPLSCLFGGQIVDNSVGLFLTGQMTVNIQSQPQTFDVTLLFVVNGAFLSATMKGQTSVDFSVFKLSNLALEIGINWEGIPSLGVAATIDVSRFESSIAVFFDSAEPSKSLVAGAVSDLHLGDVLDTLTGNIIPSDIDKVLNMVALKGTHSFQIDGKLADDLDNLKLDAVAAACRKNGGITIPSSQTQVLLVVNTKGSLWYLTDMTTMRHYMLKKSSSSITISIEAQFYCAPQATYIGSISFPEGFYINGAMEFFGFHAETTIDISINRGIAIDAQMDPIIIGSKVLFSITAENGDGGPLVSMATFTQPQEKNPLFKPPHFYINGKLEFLGLSKGIYVSLTEKGLQFDINGDLIPGINFDLKGHIDSLDNLGIEGKLKIGIGTIDLGILGKIPIKTGVKGDLSVGVSGQDIYAKLEASFEFAGSIYSLGTIDLDINEKVLLNLVSIVAKEVEKILMELLKDTWKWMEYIGEGFIEGVEDVAKALEELGKDIKDFITDSCGNGSKEQIIIKVMLQESQSASLDIIPGPVPPSQDVLDQVTQWARNSQEKMVQQYIDASTQARRMKAGKIAPPDTDNYILKYVNSFSFTYSESQVINWIEKPSLTLPVLSDFETKYYRKIPRENQFKVLVKTDLDFQNLVRDVTVTLQYPQLQPNSFQFTETGQHHLFTGPWDKTLQDQYTILYKVTFKDGTPDFQSPEVTQKDSSVTIRMPQLGVQSIRFDGSSIDFGKSLSQLDRVEITAYFSGLKDTAPPKMITLNSGRMQAAVFSTYKVPVLNTYSYRAAYYLPNQNRPVYTTPPVYSTKSIQLVYNQVQFGKVLFTGKGFAEKKVMLINLTVGETTIQLTPQKSSCEVSYSCGPGKKVIEYSGTIVGTKGPTPIRHTVRPASYTIDIGPDIPWWFSVRIDSGQINWSLISQVQVNISQGSTDNPGKATALIFQHDMPTQYWGFDCRPDETPQYCWRAKYWYKDGTVKENKSHDGKSAVSNIELVMP